MVLTTIFVRRRGSFTRVLLNQIYSWPCPEGTCSSRRFLPFTKTILTLSCKLNLEIPPYDFNEAEGKLVIG